MNGGRDDWEVEIECVHVDDPADRIRRILDLILRAAARTKPEPPAESASEPLRPEALD